MRLLRTIFITAVLALGLCSCSFFSLPDDATSEQKRVALCQDAKKGVSMGQLGLSIALPGPERVYWNRWLIGARKALDMYCPENEI